MHFFATGNVDFLAMELKKAEDIFTVTLRCRLRTRIYLVYTYHTRSNIKLVMRVIIPNNFNGANAEGMILAAIFLIRHVRETSK